MAYNVFKLRLEGSPPFPDDIVTHCRSVSIYDLQRSVR